MTDFTAAADALMKEWYGGSWFYDGPYSSVSVHGLVYAAMENAAREALEQARKELWSYGKYAGEIIETEYTDRDDDCITYTVWVKPPKDEEED